MHRAPANDVWRCGHLDANALIALVVAEHEHHERVAGWFTGIPAFAVCPIVEGALMRFLLRVGESALTASSALALIRTHPRCEFWADDVSYADLDLSGLRGHRQVTDAYLAGLASAHGGSLATLDEALANSHPAARLIPGTGAPAPVEGGVALARSGVEVQRGITSGEQFSSVVLGVLDGALPAGAGDGSSR